VRIARSQISYTLSWVDYVLKKTAMTKMAEQSPLRLAIVGYRNYFNYAQFAQKVDCWRACHEIAGLQGGRLQEIVSGGAPGTDKMAERYAKEHDIPVKVFQANWKLHGASAGPRRNALIVERATHVLAFLHPKSRGTRNTLRLARGAQKRIRVVKL